MRKEIKEALSNFLEIFQTEIDPIVFDWMELEKVVYNDIAWRRYEEEELFAGPSNMYGSESGMYILGLYGDYLIFLPRTTKAYVAFINALANVYGKDNIFYDEGDELIIAKKVPHEIILHFDGKDTISYKFVTYVHNVTDETEMSAAKTLAKELIEDLDVDVTFYEGNDEEKKDRIYSPGDVIPANYFVGFKGKWNV